MLRNKIGPVFNARNVVFLGGLFFFFFLKNPLLSAGRMIFKNKNKKQKKMDQLLTLEKAKIGPAFNSTAYIYIYFVLILVMLLNGKHVCVSCRPPYSSRPWVLARLFSVGSRSRRLCACFWDIFGSSQGKIRENSRNALYHSLRICPYPLPYPVPEILESNQQTRVYPYPLLGAGSARPNAKWARQTQKTLYF